MEPARAVFRETSASERTVEVPFAHLSVELGHFYPEDFRGGPAALADQFRRIAPWAERSRLAALSGFSGAGLRVSTCLLVDDYSERQALPSPATVIPDLLAAAAANDLVIDYIARESACADEGRVSLAPVVEKALVPDPSYGTNGSRPSVHESGWLCNGLRSQGTSGGPAMGAPARWNPPAENASRRHSIFLDVELRDDDDDGRQRWSCSFLAAVWQLLRLGLVRVQGENVVHPATVDLENLPDRWSEVPDIVRTSSTAAPFCAYRTFSALASTYVPVEHAVRVILGQVGVDPHALGSSIRRARAEGIDLAAEPVDRISYLFLGR
ncbi:hypothetical protein ACG83_37040 [Frankia sp. R43]|nr:hypothetical protein ACG83_37040 [Frankia sp. R43]